MASEDLRRWLYSSEGLPSCYTDWLSLQQPPAASTNGSTGQPSLQFLDHAWGQIAPRVLQAGLAGMARCAMLGNAAWDEVFGRLMPKTSGQVLRLLGLDPDSSADSAPLGVVHWAHNSHELVWRAISCLVDNRAASRPLVILTSDTEFYSMTRQLNRLMSNQPTHHDARGQDSAGQGSATQGWWPMLNVQVEMVEAEPASTFTQRLVQAAKDKLPDVVYCSQITYLTQRTLIPDIPSLVSHLAGVLTPTEIDADNGVHYRHYHHPPVVIVDAYHGFCALPTDLRAVYESEAVSSGRLAFGYLAGLLKHAGCGPNAAFLVTSPAWSPKPMLTGWLADFSVLDPRSAGISLGATVGYTPGLEMQGGTPAYLMPLFCFEHLMDCWDSPGHLTNPNHQSASNTSSQPASPNAPNPAGAATALVNGTKEASHEAQAPHAVSHSNSHDTQEPEPAARAAQSTVSAGHTVITVTDVHSHVMGLQARFVAGLEAMGGSGGAEPLLSVSRLVNWRDMSVETRSHTLVFQFASATEAAEAVSSLAQQGVTIDSRKGCVRVGFGYNHSLSDVDTLMRACGSCARNKPHADVPDGAAAS